jgi:predicted MFS family arabinose efflux permease
VTDHGAQGGAGGLNLNPLVGRGLFIIALLFIINIVNFIDRQLPFILIQSIKKDLLLSDSQIGLMAGLTFAIVYSFAGLPLARLADRWSPRLVITISLSFWSAMTALSGLAQSFLHLVLGRIGVAGAEAATTPTAHALISRIYQPERRALALAMFSVGVSIGSLLGLTLGGWINDLANWRVAFFIVGLPGLVIAFIAWRTLPEIPRLGDSGVDAPRFFATMRYLFGLRSFRHMALACSLYACGSYAMNVFASAFFIRVHGLTTAQAGLSFGIAFGLGGGLGTFVGGVLADSLGKRDPRWRQLIPAIGQFASVPTALGVWLIGDPKLAVVLLTFTYFFGLLYFAPSFATAQSLVSNEIRAMASAVLMFCLTLVGSSVGPMVVGWASDHLAPQYGDLSLRYAMCLMGITMLWSGVHYYIAAQALPADLERVK